VYEVRHPVQSGGVSEFRIVDASSKMISDLPRALCVRHASSLVDLAPKTRERDEKAPNLRTRQMPFRHRASENAAKSAAAVCSSLRSRHIVAV